MTTQFTAKRILLESGVKGAIMPSTPAVRTAPNTNSGSLVSIPTFQVVGADSQNVALTVGALGTGASSNLTGTIQFTGLPIVTPPANSTLWMMCDIRVSNPIAGLAIASFQIIAQVQSSGTASGIVYPGPKLPGGQTYQAYQGAVSLAVISVPATGGGTITVFSNAVLYLSPG